MRLLLLPGLFLIGIYPLLHAQTPTRVTIEGAVVDSSGISLTRATVMLLNRKDSTLINFSQTSDKGTFSFRNIHRGAYLVKVSYVGYLPYQQEITLRNDAIIDLDTIKLKPIAQELFEVVIKTAQAPLSIKGDTIEYNVSSFKVPPGSTVEDLLRKLPGVQVDQDGNVKAQGETIKKVTVDGKSFFGNDPKAATKNLPAEALQKIQVFNGKSEQSKITGVEDGKREKTMNLELKESHRKSGFGKATAGIGTEERAMVRGNYNRFNTKEQFSLIGFGNNVNQTGLSFDDYQDFRGSQSFNWQDNGDFGFSNGGFILFGDDNGLGIPITSNNSNRGFSKNFAGGVNYNYDTKKTKVSSSYFYNQSALSLNSTLNQENFLPTGSFRGDEQKKRTTFSGNHRANLRLERNIDSLNSIIFIGNARLNNGDERISSSQQFFQNHQTPDSQTTINNKSDYWSFTMATTAIYRRKFKKKGRNLAISTSFNRYDTDGKANQQSTNVFLVDSTAIGSRLNIKQHNTTNSLRTELKISSLYIEPISKRILSETFYNFNLRKDKVDRNVFDISDQGMTWNNNLSRYYTNVFTYNRVGTSLRYTNKGFNLSGGIAALWFHQEGRFAPDQTSANPSVVGKTYFSFTPNASLSYDMKNNSYLYSNYSVDIHQPSTSDLQPVVDNSNPRFIQEGNPNLLPQLTHRISGGYHLFNPASFTNISLEMDYGYHINQLVYSRTVDSLLITRARPINVNGGTSFGSYINVGFPLKKTKATLNLNSSLAISKNPTYINNTLTNTRSNNYNFGLRLDLTPIEKLSLFATATWGITNTRYSVSSAQNQQIYNHRYSADLTIQLPARLYFNSNFSYQIYQNKNEFFGFNQHLPILTLSVYRIFLKSKKGEIRLTAYDVFNKNQGITQQAYQNIVQTERTATLAQYFMLTFTYNMRGVQAQMRRKGSF